jgi:hypothetical protein
MIGRLRGLLAWKQPPYLMIDANGVGYELEASLTTFQTLPEIGAEVAAYPSGGARRRPYPVRFRQHRRARAVPQSDPGEPASGRAWRC